MKAELRIGNIVTDEFYDSFQKTIVVESINDKGINLSIENSNDYPEMQSHWIEPYYKFEQLRGVPLTEEWLKKFGFEDNSYAVFYKRINETDGCITVSFNDYTHTKLSDYPITIWPNDYSVDVKVRYVHQLQNLYYALTGNDLLN